MAEVVLGPVEVTAPGPNWIRAKTIAALDWSQLDDTGSDTVTASITKNGEVKASESVDVDFNAAQADVAEFLKFEWVDVPAGSYEVEVQTALSDNSKVRTADVRDPTLADHATNPLVAVPVAVGAVGGAFAYKNREELKGRAGRAARQRLG